jgi:hypothetical protein
VTTLDDFLGQNAEAIASMAIAERILLASSLLDSVASSLLGTDIDPPDDEDYEGYECAEEDEDY